MAVHCPRLFLQDLRLKSWDWRWLRNPMWLSARETDDPWPRGKRFPAVPSLHPISSIRNRWSCFNQYRTGAVAQRRACDDFIVVRGVGGGTGLFCSWVCNPGISRFAVARDAVGEGII